MNPSPDKMLLATSKMAVSISLSTASASLSTTSRHECGRLRSFKVFIIEFCDFTFFSNASTLAKISCVLNFQISMSIGTAPLASIQDHICLVSYLILLIFTHAFNWRVENGCTRDLKTSSSNRPTFGPLSFFFVTPSKSLSVFFFKLVIAFLNRTNMLRLFRWQRFPYNLKSQRFVKAKKDV